MDIGDIVKSKHFKNLVQNEYVVWGECGEIDKIKKIEIETEAKIKMENFHDWAHKLDGKQQILIVVSSTKKSTVLMEIGFKTIVLMKEFGESLFSYCQLVGHNRETCSRMRESIIGFDVLLSRRNDYFFLGKKGELNNFIHSFRFGMEGLLAGAKSLDEKGWKEYREWKQRQGEPDEWDKSKDFSRTLIPLLKMLNID